MMSAISPVRLRPVVAVVTFVRRARERPRVIIGIRRMVSRQRVERTTAAPRRRDRVLNRRIRRSRKASGHQQARDQQQSTCIHVSFPRSSTAARPIRAIEGATSYRSLLVARPADPLGATHAGMMMSEAFVFTSWSIYTAPRVVGAAVRRPARAVAAVDNTISHPYGAKSKSGRRRHGAVGSKNSALTGVCGATRVYRGNRGKPPPIPGWRR
jgi:hypothetical protein